MHSAIYEGRVRHRRRAPRPHAFGYRLFMLYLDLDEIESVFRGRWLWSTRRPALARFRRADYLGDERVPLKHAVADLVERKTGRRPAGPIRLLTHLRYFGYGFNPVSFYYCFDHTGSRVETIVAEITNTPWGERHAYVLDQADNLGSGGHYRYRFAKDFHVSPFMDMAFDYDWRFTSPGATLAVHMENFKARNKLFDATLALTRRDISGVALASALARYPFMTATVIAGIYWQALRLWLKRTPFHSHPAKSPGADLKNSRPEKIS
ncbi:MAG: DUF1365 domain-containing protein [Gammaproteobacteria bacterium]|nr:DUF1365 domain-containing protein [Gammaproteobacteria bacterium]MDH3406519.1 DUF1365 domain-containing protein [Gammaproteobacteria bacterium]MDH5487813.1 DUF1365 domain-containing protein [Gammaproteobacteria bacterium]